MAKDWPENYEKETSPSWTAKYPRPEEGGPHHPSLVESRQAEWDSAEKRRVQQAATAQTIRDDREAKRQAERAAAEAEAEAKRQQKSNATEQMLRRRFLAAGGSESEWQEEKAAIVSEHRRRLIAEGDATEQQKRAAQSVLYQNF